MIKNFDKKLTRDAKYVQNFRILGLICTRQLDVFDPKGRLRKVNISDIHKILSVDFLLSCIPDEQIFAKKGKYINEPQILKEVSVINTFLQDYFPDIGPRHQGI